MIDNKKEQFKRKIERRAKDIMGVYWDGLIAFFQNIINEASEKDIICFVTRRCYVLYVLVAYIKGWKFDPRIITDLGLYPNCDRIKKVHRIFVIDDAAIKGFSIVRAVRSVAAFANSNAEICPRLFVMCSEVPQKRRLIPHDGGRIIVEREETLSRRDANRVSIKMTQIIEACGMPYTTFVYPLFGYGVRIQNSNKAQKRPQTQTNALSKYCWDTEYKMCGKRYELFDIISEFYCMRVYRDVKNKDTNGICMYEREINELRLPFVMLKDIKGDVISEYFSILKKNADCFGGAIADILQQSCHDISEKGSMYKSGIIYSRELESLLYSRLISVTEGAEGTGGDIDFDLIDLSLGGSFSESVISELKNIKPDMAIEFLDKQTRDIKRLNESYCGLGLNEILREPEYIETILSVKRSLSSGSSMFKLIWSILQEIKEKNVLDESSIPAVHTSRLMSVAKQYSIDRDDWDIVESIIRCWDQGIASYRYRLEPGGHLTSYCGAGEMSALKMQMIYGEGLRNLYDKDAEIVYSEDEIWSRLFKSEMSQDPEEEHKEFAEWYKKNDGDLYQFISL